MHFIGHHGSQPQHQAVHQNSYSVRSEKPHGFAKFDRILNKIQGNTLQNDNEYYQRMVST